MRVARCSVRAVRSLETMFAGVRSSLELQAVVTAQLPLCLLDFDVTFRDSDWDGQGM